MRVSECVRVGDSENEWVSEDRRESWISYLSNWLGKFSWSMNPHLIQKFCSYPHLSTSFISPNLPHLLLFLHFYRIESPPPLPSPSWFAPSTLFSLWGTVLLTEYLFHPATFSCIEHFTVHCADMGKPQQSRQQIDVHVFSLVWLLLCIYFHTWICVQQ